MEKRESQWKNGPKIEITNVTERRPQKANK